ncbi:uncharacterized protein LOC127833923 isoform X2 [Dreissena polymorpha]|uniref:uncharacterized protein LOC127833923 isoform X2 n=1 Tax=Dreissena polymorpha TaxID=45954 RepID=UPI0022646EDF|nr:uncharacterized protein LOC127833923 isoform X2 [Dreissena polymorpha]
MFQSPQMPSLVSERHNSSLQNSYTGGSQSWSPGTVTCDCVPEARYFQETECGFNHTYYPRLDWDADALNSMCNTLNGYNQHQSAGLENDFLRKETFAVENSARTSLNQQDSFGIDVFNFLEELCKGRVGENTVTTRSNFHEDPQSQEMQSLHKATYTRPSAHVTLSPQYDDTTGATIVLVAGHNYPTDARSAAPACEHIDRAGLKKDDCLLLHEDRIIQEEKPDFTMTIERVDRDECCLERKRSIKSLPQMKSLKMETDGLLPSVHDTFLYGNAQASYCEFNNRLIPLTWENIDVSNLAMTKKTDHDDTLDCVGDGKSTYHELSSESSVANENITSRNITSSPTKAENYHTTAALPTQSRSRKAATSRLPSFSSSFCGSADAACSMNHVSDNTHTSGDILQGLFSHAGLHHFTEMDDIDTYDNSIDDLDILISNHLMSERERALSPEVPLMVEEAASQLMHICTTRPTTRQKEKAGCRIWEYIRDLLLSPETNPSLITWENREKGVFKLVKSKEIAKMWGRKKGNEEMNYEKFSRAMRYHYKRKVFEPVIGKRLVYKFGPRATGWQMS